MSALEIAERFDLSNPPKNLEDIQSLKFHPKSLIPTISRNSPNKLVMRYWSLIPRWWKDDPRKIKFSTFNARAEDIATKPTYRSAWSHRQRCLIPATWFYEFQTAAPSDGSKPKKIPYRVEVVGEEIVGLAGLYETWTDGQHRIESCTVITRSAISPLKAIHDRQPVILKQSLWEAWLNPATAAGEIKLLIQTTVPLAVSEFKEDFFHTSSE